MESSPTDLSTSWFGEIDSKSLFINDNSETRDLKIELIGQVQKDCPFAVDIKSIDDLPMSFFSHVIEAQKSDFGYEATFGLWCKLIWKLFYVSQLCVAVSITFFNSNSNVSDPTYFVVMMLVTIIMVFCECGWLSDILDYFKTNDLVKHNFHYRKLCPEWDVSIQHQFSFLANDQTQATYNRAQEWWFPSRGSFLDNYKV